MDSDLLNKKNLTILTYVALISYISLRPHVPANILQYIQHPITKLLLVLLVVYFSKVDFTIAILLLLSYIVTYLACTTENFANSSTTVSLAFNDDLRKNTINIDTAFDTDITKTIKFEEIKNKAKITHIKAPVGSKIEFTICDKKETVIGDNSWKSIPREKNERKKCIQFKGKSKNIIGDIAKTQILENNTVNQVNSKMTTPGYYENVTSSKNPNASYVSNYVYDTSNITSRVQSQFS